MKIVIVARDQGQLSRRRAALSALASLNLSVALQVGGCESVLAAVQRERPDVVILDGVCESTGNLADVDAVTHAFPEMSVIVVGAISTPEFLKAAMHAGVREVVEGAADTTGIETALRRVADKVARRVMPKIATVLVWLPCKGGSGATFLAANTAYLLASEYGKRTALVDVDLSVGDAAFLVTERPAETNIADIARNISRLDASMLVASMQHVLPNFAVLAAPDSLERGMEVTADRVDEIMALLESLYDYVVVNVGRNIDNIAVRAIDRATWLLPVLQLSVPAIRDTRRVLSTLESLGVASETIHLVASRVDRHGEIEVGDAERTLGRKVEISIPNDYLAVSKSENQGVPLARLDPQNPIVRAARQLIEGMPGCEAKPRAGWIANLLKGN